MAQVGTSVVFPNDWIGVFRGGTELVGRAQTWWEIFGHDDGWMMCCCRAVVGEGCEAYSSADVDCITFTECVGMVSQQHNIAPRSSMLFLVVCHWTDFRDSIFH